MNIEKYRLPILLIAGILIISVIVYLESMKVSPKRTNDSNSLADSIISRSGAVEDKKELYDFAHEISTPDGYINTDGINVEELIGEKIILIDFWTYSCINCQRTFPYLNAWYEKYNDQGLEILGIHTPEFEFEKEYDNVLKAVKQFELKHPVILDNDFSTWQAYKNRYWPRKYLIDIDGYIVYDHIGEGGYDETERVIQKLLQERNERIEENIIVPQNIVSPENVETTQASSPEIYFGAWRNDLLGNGTPRIEGVQKFSLPNDLTGNALYLEGAWDITREFATNQGEGSIVFSFNAKKVFMVASGVVSMEALILIDGKVVGDLSGSDVDKNGVILFDTERLYNLIDDPTGPAVHTLEIRLKNPGLKAYTFTFG
jgi:thiol-disulfide isomerase/thioredoxin